MTGVRFGQRTLEPPARSMSNNDYAANFSDFLKQVPENQPWCFWYGTLEPHRGYESGVGTKKGGKRLSDIDRVPKFWPDNDTTRNDMLDYAFEVEHFDLHLVRILKQLASRGFLKNTLVIVTSDHGMPFPRCKGQAYDCSNHVPLAIMWHSTIAKPGRSVDDYVSFVDIAPTLIQAAGLTWDEGGMQPTVGRSLFDLFSADSVKAREHVLIGKERHDIGRPNDVGYPIRGIIKDDFLYIRNYEPNRWPAGNPETGYLNCDGSPTKTVILNGRRDGSDLRSWALCFGRRPAEELFDLGRDSECMNNLAISPAHQDLKHELQQQMVRELQKQGDPRLTGQSDYFDKIRYSNDSNRNFYERWMNGENVRAGWVNDTDSEKQPIRSP